MQILGPYPRYPDLVWNRVWESPLFNKKNTTVSLMRLWVLHMCVHTQTYTPIHFLLFILITIFLNRVPRAELLYLQVFDLLKEVTQIYICK